MRTQADNGDTAGERVHPDATDPLRDPFEVDRRRIIECTAFRRLQHKTQAFATGAHDHFRTRLTHTLEAADIARSLAANLGANVHLAEAITLAHDLGHPPFGHAGEAALQKIMSAFGGFNHNAHSLRVVEHLEHPYPAFRGLNLTHGTLEGLRHHASRYDKPSDNAASDPSLEAVISSVADRIAYNCHDIEDAIGAGLLTADALMEVALWREAIQFKSRGAHADHIHAIRRFVLDEIIDRLAADAVSALTSGHNRPGVRARCEEACPSATPMFTLEMESRLQELESFLIARVYRDPQVMRMDEEGCEKIRALFDAYASDPSAMPGRYADRVAGEGLHRVVCDYIAGMTDRFVAAECQRLCS